MSHFIWFERSCQCCVVTLQQINGLVHDKVRDGSRRHLAWVPPLSRIAPRARLVTSCQTFVGGRHRAPVRSFGQPALPEPKHPEPYGQSAPRPREIANGEIEADEHHERDKPLIALGRTVRDDKHLPSGPARSWPPALSTSALRGPRSSDDSEIFTHPACLLLRRKVLDALAKPTEPLGRLLARIGWSRTITLEPV
jgi:hypothetical protein